MKILSKHFGDRAGRKIETYEATGGYKGLRKAIGMQPEAILEEVKRSNLRGRGGAGFPTARKWSFLPKGAQTVYLVVNADEGEPGTFKDRTLMRWNPHSLIEGVIVTSLAIGCHHAYIYIRGELVEEASYLETAIEEARKRGFLGKSVLTKNFALEITVHRGAGAYICGEETALLDSLEGKRGHPRNKPPFPAVEGAWAKPTIVNNVETIAYVPWILQMGGEEFAKLGVPGEGGLRLASVGGHVNRPGTYEVPVGTTVKEIIYGDDYCQGMWGGELLGVIPGGSSVPVMTADEVDTPWTIEALGSDEKITEVEVSPGDLFDMGGGRSMRSSPGSGAITVFNDKTDVVALCARLMRFYAHESCGQCTPCRIGCNWLARASTAFEKGNGTQRDLDLMGHIADGIAGNSICALGDGAAWPMMAFLTKFRPQFEARLLTDEKRKAASG